jgi:signal transduction histidine kinase
LLRDDEVIGAINIYRKEVQPFTDKQIELLSDFAKQAVIAIENTRLFEAEQASKRELQESLEYQTAISDVLGVISASPSDVRPAYQNIVETACRLCRADRAAVWRLVEGGFQVVARANDTGPPARFAGITPIDRDSLAGRVGLEGRTVHIPDILADPDYHKFRSRAGDDRRSMLGVPLMRQQQVIGAIILVRTRLEPFGHAEIRLVETFADQAVIAIENAQLFEEVEQKNAALNAANSQLTESLEQQTATSEVLEVISSSPGELEPVFQVMLSNAVRICEARFGLLFRYEDGAFGAVASIGVPSKYGDYIQQRGAFRAASHAPLGRLAIAQQPIHIPDLKAYPSYVDGLPSMRAMADLGGARTLLVVPMLKEDNLMGAISIYRTEVRPFTDKQIELVQNFASQAVIAIENTRLLNELRESLRQLEIASQHKSQFVANMSHELRTPLAAILGYAELMQEGFYEPLGEKSLDALTRIRSNGKHLLGLINTVLDIAKIESGQFNLSLGEYAIGNVVETVRAATESLAETKKLALKTDVARSLPIGFGDEQRLTQVLLNLVGNAIKFTDAGEVRITARAENGHFWVSVADTGPGIPADQLTRVFEQFHQVDNSNTKKTGGTGLGLAIAKQIVEMHGGRVWVESALGKGATFQMQLPIRAEYRKAAAE